MRTREVKLTAPKSRGAALSQATYMYQQIENCSRRKENIMKNSKSTEMKIQDLQLVIEGYRTQIASVDTTKANWEVELKKLKDAWNLTDAEILELRSQLLREQISELQRQAGVSETGKTTLN